MRRISDRRKCEATDLPGDLRVRYQLFLAASRAEPPRWNAFFRCNDNVTE